MRMADMEKDMTKLEKRDEIPDTPKPDTKKRIDKINENEAEKFCDNPVWNFKKYLDGTGEPWTEEDIQELYRIMECLEPLDVKEAFWANYSLSKVGTEFHLTNSETFQHVMVFSDWSINVM